MTQVLKKKIVLGFLSFQKSFLLIIQLDSAIIPFSQEKLQTALQKLMENEKRCDEWQDDLQQQRADWEASGTLLKGVSLMPKRDLGKKLLGSLLPGIW